MKRATLIAGLMMVLVCASLAQSHRTGERTRQGDRRGSGRPTELTRRAPARRAPAPSVRPSRPSVRQAPLPQEVRTDPNARTGPGNRRREYDNVFSNIQRGISSGSVEAFSGHMAQQVYVNLRGGESGYYSASQAYYLLDNYFRTRKFGTFNFTTIGESDSNPYATGSARCTVRGGREYAQIYVSLSHAGERWVITQINIY